MRARNCLFFKALTGLQCDVFNSPGHTVFDDFKILTDPAARRRMVAQFAPEIGSVEVDFLCAENVVLLYQRSRKEFDESAQLFEQFNGFLIAKIAKVGNWLGDLWQIRDNSVNNDAGWLAVQLDDRFQITTNVWHNSFSKANAGDGNVYFSREDFKRAADSPFRSEYGEDVGPVPLITPGFHGGVDTKLEKDAHRITRFVYFVSGARGSRDLAIKILLYCSGLEALFSNTTAEIAHQVAERCALTIGTDEKSKASTYRSIKNAYGMRSKAVHGATFDKRSVPRLISSCVEVDEICRTLVNQIIGDENLVAGFSLGDSDYSDFWTNKLFS